MKRIPVEKIILFLAATYASYNFGLAGGYIEQQAFSVGGLVAGVVVNISLAVAASRYGSLNGKKRTRQANAAFLAMLLISPLVVAPVVYYKLPATFLSEWMRAAWAIGWTVVADLAIVLAGAVSGKGLIALTEETTQSAKSAPHSDAGATDSAKSAKKVRRTATDSAKSATDSDALRRTYPRMCEHCDAQISSPNAVGAHMKKHHPDLCKPKEVVVTNLFEKVQS